jgi:hypothetical protein
MLVFCWLGVLCGLVFWRAGDDAFGAEGVRNRLNVLFIQAQQYLLMPWVTPSRIPRSDVVQTPAPSRGWCSLSACVPSCPAVDPRTVSLLSHDLFSHCLPTSLSATPLTLAAAVFTTQPVQAGTFT